MLHSPGEMQICGGHSGAGIAYAPGWNGQFLLQVSTEFLEAGPSGYC